MEKQNPKHIDYWVACSGGADSVFLARILHLQNKKIGLLHCNFKLRGKSSDKDAEFVLHLAEELDVPIQIQAFDTVSVSKSLKLNIQQTARKLRYDWFRDIYDRTQIPIALAHHYDDQIETFILQLLRGGSVRGLAGMPIMKDGILRPLLNTKSSTIRELCTKLSWNWREDSSNQDSKYKRNFIRNEVIPALELDGVQLDTFYDTAKLYSNLLAFINSWNPSLATSPPLFWKKNEWDELPILLKKELIQRSIGTETNLLTIEQLFKAEKGARNILNKLIIFKEENGLSIIPSNQKKWTIQIETIDKKEQTNLSSPDFLFFDYAKIKGSIYARIRETGDAFRPIGMSGKKLISDFLKDRKVPHAQRESLFVICDDSGIIGLIGFCPDDRKKVTANTKLVVKISVCEEHS
jgi:tRNA(Ile)-lysidine synthase